MLSRTAGRLARDGAAARPAVDREVPVSLDTRLAFVRVFAAWVGRCNLAWICGSALVLPRVPAVAAGRRLPELLADERLLVLALAGAVSLPRSRKLISGRLSVWRRCRWLTRAVLVADLFELTEVVVERLPLLVRSPRFSAALSVDDLCRFAVVLR
jgi:hypothetical protein